MSDRARVKIQVCLTSELKLLGTLTNCPLFTKSSSSQGPASLLSLSHIWPSDWVLASETREMSATCRPGPLETSVVIFPCDLPSVLHADEHGLNHVLNMVQPRERRRLQIRNTGLIGLHWARDKTQIILIHWDLEVYLFQQTLHLVASRHLEFRDNKPGILISIMIYMNNTKRVVQSYICREKLYVRRKHIAFSAGELMELSAFNVNFGYELR